MNDGESGGFFHMASAFQRNKKQCPQLRVGKGVLRFEGEDIEFIILGLWRENYMWQACQAAVSSMNF